MLTSFFGNSNPVNYIILSVFIVLGYVLGVLPGNEAPFTLANFPLHMVWILVVVFSLFVLDFLIRKNNCTKNNTYAIVVFSAFLVFLPSVLREPDVLIANLLLLLAARRIISLKSEKNTEKKLLDASIYIILACLFYYWSLLFFIFMYVSLFRKSDARFRHYLIPVAAVVAMFVLISAFYVLWDDSLNWFLRLDASISFDFLKYNASEILIPATLLIAFIIWMGGTRLLKLGNLGRMEAQSTSVVLIWLLISIVIALFSTTKTGAELVFVLAPTAIIIANFIETEEGRKPSPFTFWFKEVLLWAILLTPVLFWFI